MFFASPRPLRQVDDAADEVGLPHGNQIGSDKAHRDLVAVLAVHENLPSLVVVHACPLARE